MVETCFLADCTYHQTMSSLHVAIIMYFDVLHLMTERNSHQEVVNNVTNTLTTANGNIHSKCAMLLLMMMVFLFWRQTKYGNIKMERFVTTNESIACLEWIFPFVTDLIYYKEMNDWATFLVLLFNPLTVKLIINVNT